LKGTPGEEKKLVSSATKASVYFDPANAKCPTTPNTNAGASANVNSDVNINTNTNPITNTKSSTVESQKCMETTIANNLERITISCAVTQLSVEGVRAATADTQAAIANLRQQQSENYNLLQMKMDRLNVSNLEKIIQNSFANYQDANRNFQETFLREIQSQKSENATNLGKWNSKSARLRIVFVRTIQKFWLNTSITR
jgi:hypothetical protein